MVSDLTCSTFLWRITVSTPLSPWSVRILAPLSCPVLKDAKETPNVYEAVRVRDNGSGSGGRTCQNRAPGKRFHRAHRKIQRLAAQAARRPCAGAGAQQRRRRIAGQARRQGTAKRGERGGKEQAGYPRKLPTSRGPDWRAHCGRHVVQGGLPCDGGDRRAHARGAVLEGWYSQCTRRPGGPTGMQ